MPPISSLTDSLHHPHDPGWPPPGSAASVGGQPARGEESEQGILISNVTVIYGLYFPGKAPRFISSRQAVYKHSTQVLLPGWVSPQGLMPTARKSNTGRPEARPRAWALKAHPKMHEIIALFFISWETKTRPT